MSMSIKKDDALFEQASKSIARMTIHYCNYISTMMQTKAPTAENCATIQDSIRTLNHISVALERMRRILEK